MKPLIDRIRGNGEPWTFEEIYNELRQAYKCIYLNVDPMDMNVEFDEIYSNACEEIEKT